MYIIPNDDIKAIEHGDYKTAFNLVAQENEAFRQNVIHKLNTSFSVKITGGDYANKDCV